MQDDVQFCPKCGTAVNQTASPAPHGKRLHCPECGGHDLAPFVENSGAFSGSTRMNSSKSWICKDCGHMFRHPDDVVKEVKQKTKAVIVTISFLMGCMALFALFVSAIAHSNAMPILLVLGLILGGGIFLARFLEKRELKKAEELRKACLE